jgi:putative endonuclease
MEHWTYILYSAALGKYYIGSTKDLTGRIRRHLSNHKGYTAATDDWELVYSEKYPTKGEASKRERQLKSWKNKNRLQDLILRGSEHPDA